MTTLMVMREMIIYSVAKAPIPLMVELETMQLKVIQEMTILMVLREMII
jgi:hypothetical protein